MLMLFLIDSGIVLASFIFVLQINTVCFQVSILSRGTNYKDVFLEQITTLHDWQDLILSLYNIKTLQTSFIFFDFIF